MKGIECCIDGFVQAFIVPEQSLTRSVYKEAPVLTGVYSVWTTFHKATASGYDKTIVTAYLA